MSVYSGGLNRAEDTVKCPPFLVGWAWGNYCAACLSAAFCLVATGGLAGVAFAAFFPATTGAASGLASGLASATAGFGAATFLFGGRRTMSLSAKTLNEFSARWRRTRSP